MNERYVSTKELIRTYGISATSLRKWSDEDKLRFILTPGGHRKYSATDVEKLLRSKSKSNNVVLRPLRTGIIYARVSSQKQKAAGDLQRQIDSITQRYPHHEVISDVGSGINYQRSGFISLLDRVQRGLVSEVVVAQRDRLCRFGFDLVEWIFKSQDTSIVVLSKDDQNKDSTTELAEDLLAITTVFVSKHHGRRRYSKDVPTEQKQGEYTKHKQECQ